MIVVDASVVARVVLDEIGSEETTQMFETNKEMVVPDFCFLEIANTLATKTNSSEEKIEKVLNVVYEMGFRVEKVEMSLLIKTAKLAWQKKVAVYDMIYAVIAMEKKCKLITADRKFAEKTGFKFVEVI